MTYIDEMIIEYNIVQFLPLQSLRRLGQTNKRFRDVCNARIRNHPRSGIEDARAYHVAMYNLYAGQRRRRKQRT